jgi:hypothetical protein
VDKSDYGVRHVVKVDSRRVRVEAHSMKLVAVLHGDLCKSLEVPLLYGFLHSVHPVGHTVFYSIGQQVTCLDAPLHSWSAACRLSWVAHLLKFRHLKEVTNLNIHWIFTTKMRTLISGQWSEGTIWVATESSPDNSSPMCQRTKPPNMLLQALPEPRLAMFETSPSIPKTLANVETV